MLHKSKKQTSTFAKITKIVVIIMLVFTILGVVMAALPAFIG